jgi:hypothetical protein
MVTMMRWASLLTSSVYLFLCRRRNLSSCWTSCTIRWESICPCTATTFRLHPRRNWWISSLPSICSLQSRSSVWRYYMYNCTNMSRADRGESSFVRLLCLLYYLNIMWADCGKLQLQSNLDPTESLSEIPPPLFFVCVKQTRVRV